MKSIIVDWKMVGIVGGAMLAGGAMIAYAFFRPAVDPEERRNHLDDAKETLSQLQSILDSERDAKRLVPSLRNH